ncbi:hypothetical protein GRI62_13035 [Erythrobacter arachoides]|uniref:Terminase n=1 Tax=Aurantiacibacter arachoides TaxID=1850444 RepID=A0A845A529_9SPHN|nr:hypothetical protein [Aurantiacibacter arachoides]MXO94522.1 hypothetical protein [Aurantiacibacter arachoides]GGD62810.1 hypothetical protein GCM10011411_23840 [Aurantiacibacter arachoides]
MNEGIAERAAWIAPFLEKLAESSNVAASARAAGVSSGTAYAARRKDREFARDWRRALCEGYDNLEIELLSRLRRGQRPTETTKYDNAAAIRLLLAHRDEVSQQRALDEDEDEDAILASLTGKLEAMRQRQIETQQLLAEDGMMMPSAGA